MRICDICGSLATCKIIFNDDKQEYDLCASHKEKIIEVIEGRQEEENDRPKRGRPKKLE